MLSYWRACAETSADVLRAVALAMGLSEDHFVRLHANEDSNLELKVYRAAQAERGAPLPEAGQLRVQPHADLSSLTLRRTTSTGSIVSVVSVVSPGRRSVP